jgi:hypothetical protein
MINKDKLIRMLTDDFDYLLESQKLRKVISWIIIFKGTSDLSLKNQIIQDEFSGANYGNDTTQKIKQIDDSISSFNISTLSSIPRK